MDFGDLKRQIRDRIVSRMDRRHLNFDVDFLQGVNPTAENIAVGIWRELESGVAPARLVRVTLHETERNTVVYEGGQR
jgi:6-pyruvoyltetrahydropterin/6-carboxytetrahydropterin synthase